MTGRDKARGLRRVLARCTSDQETTEAYKPLTLEFPSPSFKTSNSTVPVRLKTVLYWHRSGSLREVDEQLDVLMWDITLPGAIGIRLLRGYH